MSVRGLHYLTDDLVQRFTNIVSFYSRWQQQLSDTFLIEDIISHSPVFWHAEQSRIAVTEECH